jgi:hypothetical protein
VHLFNDEAGRRLYEDVKSQELLDKYLELDDRLKLEVSENKGALVRLSKADILTVADYTVARANVQKLSKLDVVHYLEFATFDTIFYNTYLVSKQFYVEGIGVFTGGEINYLGIGIFAALYNYSKYTLAALNVGWNSSQILTFQGWSHNVRQIKFGSAWSNFGHRYYNNPESINGE